MFTCVLIAATLLPDQCPCGPGCACGQGLSYGYSYANMSMPGYTAAPVSYGGCPVYSYYFTPQYSSCGNGMAAPPAVWGGNVYAGCAGGSYTCGQSWPSYGYATSAAPCYAPSIYAPAYYGGQRSGSMCAGGRCR